MKYFYKIIFVSNFFPNQIIEPINKLLGATDFDLVIYSLDWHPIDHISFIENVKNRPLHSSCSIDADSTKVFDTVIFNGSPSIEQRLWPRHCVQNSWGSELHEDLVIAENSTKVYKGVNSEIDSYSAFWDNGKMSETTLNAFLKEKEVTDVYVCGLAYDVCVYFTVIDAISSGYHTILLEDCCRGVDLKEIENCRNTIKSANGVVTTSTDVNIYVNNAFFQHFHNEQKINIYFFYF